jgi:ionotropic glutamate receptor
VLEPFVFICCFIVLYTIIKYQNGVFFFFTASNMVLKFCHLFPLVISFLLLISDGGGAAYATKVTNIGGIIDVTSRIGKEQKIAIEIAAESFNRYSETNKLSLHFQDSGGLDPLQVASAGQ